MTRKDFARMFREGETLEVTSHWRNPNMVGQRRVVTKIGRTAIEFIVDVRATDEGYQTPSDLPYDGVTYLSRQNGSIHVEWGDDQYITYRIVQEAV